MAMVRSPRRRRRRLAGAARGFQPANLGPAVPVCRDGQRPDYAPASGRGGGDRLDRSRRSAGPVHDPGRAVGFRQRHGVVDRRGVSVRTRICRDAPRRAYRVHHRRAHRRKPAQARLLDRPGRSRHGADDAVQHGARGRHPFSHHAERGAGVRIGAGPDGLEDRRVPDEDALSGGSRRVGDVPDRHRPESARRRVDEAGLGSRGDVDDVGVGRVGPRGCGPDRRALRRVPAVPADRARHGARAEAGCRAPAGDGPDDAARARDAGGVLDRAAALALGRMARRVADDGRVSRVDAAPAHARAATGRISSTRKARGTRSSGSAGS